MTEAGSGVTSIGDHNALAKEAGTYTPSLALHHSGGKQWFAVNTLPSSEARARANLERQGWRCFSPRLLKTNRNARRLVTQLRPLFPSYIFVELDLTQPGWRSVDSTYGVRSIVKQSGRPAPLPANCIETLMSMTDENGVFSFSKHLERGDNVQFLAGPFAGFVGSLEQIDAHGRITILLTLLGQATLVHSRVQDVAPVRAGTSS